MPGLTYLAEVYWDLEWTLQEQGFHYTYDKRLLDRLQASSPGDVRAHLRADRPFRDRLARFLENHDEPRSAVSLAHRLLPAATLVATLPGLRFFFDGQFAGASLRAPVQLARWPIEIDRPAIADFYARLLAALNDPLFHDGEWSLLEVRSAGDGTSANLIAAAWRLDHQLAVVAANLSTRESHGLVQLGALPAAGAFDVVDRLTDARYRWSRGDLEHGAYVRLDAGDAHLLLVHPS